MDDDNRCATGSWPGQSQCVNPVAEDPFCFTCWLSIGDMGPDCDCPGCAVYFKAIS